LKIVAVVHAGYAQSVTKKTDFCGYAVEKIHRASWAAYGNGNYCQGTA
jgi:hypothetical protein